LPGICKKEKPSALTIAGLRLMTWKRNKERQLFKLPTCSAHFALKIGEKRPCSNCCIRLTFRLFRRKKVGGYCHPGAGWEQAAKES
jgi:hypothetical protein